MAGYGNGLKALSLDTELKPGDRLGAEGVLCLCVEAYEFFTLFQHHSHSLS